MTTTETLKLALEALEHLQPTALTSFYTIGDRDKAITALREALASEAIEQPAPVASPHEQEPVAFLVDGDLYYPEEIDWETLQEQGHTVASLYTSPPTLSLAQRLPDKLVYDGYETPQYIEGWNDCREFMKGMK